MKLHRMFLALVSTVALLAFAGVTRPSLATAETPASLRILFSSSVQGKLHDCGCKSKPLGGLARRAALLQELSQGEANVLLLDGGNLLPSPESREATTMDYFARATADLGVAGVGIGPRELSQGDLALRSIATGSGLNFVSANYLENSHQSPIEAFRVMTRAGVRIAFTSVVSPSLETAAASGMSLDDPLTSLRRVLPEMHAAADLVVLACSMPAGETETLISQLDSSWAPDLVLEANGGTHLAQARQIGRSTLVAANAQGKYLGQADYVRGTGGEWQVDYTLHSLSLDLPEDPEVVAAVGAAEARAAELASNRRPEAR